MFKNLRALMLMTLVITLIPFITVTATTSDTVYVKETESVRQAKNLLDSWSGQQEILDQAKSILDAELEENPRNYLALKELARYTIMDGYLHSVQYSNGTNIYKIGKYEPGTLEAAEALLKRALLISPNFADGYVMLGHVYEQMRRFSEASKALTKAENIGTDNPWLDLNWASVLIDKGKLEQAAIRYRKVINAGTENKKALTTAYDYMIEYHRRRDEHREVRELYHAMFKIQPDNAWVRGNYAKYLMNDLGLYDEAIEYAVKALEIMNYGQARATLAYALYSKWADLVMNQGVVEEDAKEYLAQAYQLYPNVDLVMAYRGSRNNGGDLARALKSKGVSIDARVEDGSTALIIASNAGQTNAVRNLLLLGANINAKSKNGLTALLGAADEGHHEIVQILLENGADKTQKIAGFTPAQLAERRGDKTLALLIQNFNAK